MSNNYTTIQQLTECDNHLQHTSYEWQRIQERTFTLVELNTLSKSDLAYLADCKQLTEEEISEYGDRRKRETYITAILSDQEIRERIFYDSQPTEPTCCEDCPLAVNFDDYIKCTAMRKPYGETITDKPFAVNEDCWRELQKVRNQEGDYARHHLNNIKSERSRRIRQSVNPHALAWFNDWQNNDNWEVQMHCEQDDINYQEWCFLRDQIEQTNVQYPTFEFVLIENNDGWEVSTYYDGYLVAIIECTVFIYNPTCSVFNAYYKGVKTPELLISSNELSPCVESLMEDYSALASVA